MVKINATNQGVTTFPNILHVKQAYLFDNVYPRILHHKYSCTCWSDLHTSHYSHMDCLNIHQYLKKQYQCWIRTRHFGLQRGCNRQNVQMSFNYWYVSQQGNMKTRSSIQTLAESTIIRFWKYMANCIYIPTSRPNLEVDSYQWICAQCSGKKSEFWIWIVSDFFGAVEMNERL